MRLDKKKKRVLTWLISCRYLYALLSLESAIARWCGQARGRPPEEQLRVGARCSQQPSAQQIPKRKECKTTEKGIRQGAWLAHTDSRRVVGVVGYTCTFVDWVAEAD